MEQKAGGADQKRINKIRIAKYIYHNKEASKQEIAAELGLSMPTVLQRVKELLADGIITESGEYESTGGRKAKALSIAVSARCAAGMDITRNHVSFVLLDAGGELRAKKRLRLTYEDRDTYYRRLGEELLQFLDECRVKKELLLGVGISIPGIVDDENGRLLQSHVLKLRERDLSRFADYIPWKTSFFNDANSAAYAELRRIRQNTIYLSLSNTVGGAIYMNGGIYKGDAFKSAEFGHMILVPEGKDCYCGEKGCMDAYCAAALLAKWTDDDLEQFFAGLSKKDETCMSVWKEYLSYLAIAISNLRMAFDCDVILGGYVGGYMEHYLPMLEEELFRYRIFENDKAYVRTGRYKHEAAAIGAGVRFVEEYFDSIQ